MSFIDRVRECSIFQPADYLPFTVDGQNVGLVRPEFAALLASDPNVFAVSPDRVTLAQGLRGPEDRTNAIEPVLKRLANAGILDGWRDERYEVAAKLDAPPLFLMERAAIPKFGVWASGVHLNGYVRDGQDLWIWVGRRSPDKQTAPNKLDQIVAGGRPAGLSVRETLLKEGEEEAAIDGGLASRATAAGAIAYCTERSEGLRRDVLFVFDLEMPRDFVPVNHDGEIAEFQLWPVRRAMEAVRDTTDFKFNCALVLIDFLIRHGIIEPDDEPDYLALLRGRHCSEGW